MRRERLICPPTRKKRPTQRPRIHSQPWLERPCNGQPPCEQIILHNVPGVVRNVDPDYAAAKTVHRIARMVSEDFPTIGDYVSRLMGEFEDAELCTIYLVPKNSAGKQTMLEHRLSVYRENQELVVDESPGALERHQEFSKLLNSTMELKRPLMIDFESKLRMEFVDLDMDSDRCDVYPHINGHEKGSLAIMPFYYRDTEHPSGLVVFEGDLTCKGSKLNGLAKAFWSAKTAVASAAQISFQLTHKFDAITILSKYADFQVDFKQGIRQLMDKSISNLHLVLVDLDDFKKVNDNYGYETGNDVLRMVAEKIKSCVRQSDHVARWGGEEFAVILKDVSDEKAMQVAERIRRRIAEIKIQDRSVTGSIGVADVAAVANRVLESVHGEFADTEIYDRAFLASDQNLKTAKKNGKNQVIMNATSV